MSQTTSSTSDVLYIPHYCLVIGGNGALGRAIITKYKEIGWKTISIDFSETENVDESFYIQSFEKYEIEQIITRLIQQNYRLSAIYVLSGVQIDGTIQDNVLSLVEEMFYYNVVSPIAGLSIASQCLEPEGMIVLLGSLSADSFSPNSLLYGMTKNCVQYLTKCFTEPKVLTENSDECGRIERLSRENGLPREAKVICVVPSALDSPVNRTKFTDSTHILSPLHLSVLLKHHTDLRKIFSEGASTELAPLSSLTENQNTSGTILLTPIEDIATGMRKWSTDKQLCPQSGSVIDVVTIAYKKMKDSIESDLILDEKASTEKMTQVVKTEFFVRGSKHEVEL